MEFSLSAESLSRPWYRALAGVVLIVIGIAFFTLQKPNSDITREDCTEVEASLYDLRVEWSDDGVTNGIWLIFDDYDKTLDIHSSCVTDELLSDLIDLEKGTRMKFLHSNESSNIYELWVDGEKWLDFDTTKATISGNMAIVKYVSYGLIPVGALLIISVPVMELIKKLKKNEQNP